MAGKPPLQTLLNELYLGGNETVMPDPKLDLQLREALAEFKELERAHQMAFATGNYRFIKAAAEAKDLSFRKLSATLCKLRKQQNNK
jgi:hypothetical protein